MSSEAPAVKTLHLDNPALGATSDATVPVEAAPFAGTVTGVTYIPTAAITGAATNTRTLEVVNKGQAGTGTNVVATLALVSGVNPAADKAAALTLSGTASKLVVAEGDVLAFASTHGGTGIADPGGTVSITVSRS